MAKSDTPRLSNGKPDWSRIGRRSGRIGKTYERKVAGLLTTFTKVNFRRVPSSGGFNKQGLVVKQESFCGDVICDRSDFKFCIEAKNREVFNFHSLLVNPNTAAFSEWWYQCLEDAKSVNLLPMMFFKPENGEDFIALTDAGMLALNIRRESWPADEFGVQAEYGRWLISHFQLQTYHFGPITITQNLKVKGQKKKVKTKIDAQLPNPYIVRWKTLIKHISADAFFAPVKS